MAEKENSSSIPNESEDLSGAKTPAPKTEHDAVLNDPFIGLVLGGKFELLSLLGSGGWANVYRARHITLGSDVAVKVIHAHLSQDEHNRKRLEKEAKLLSQLDSPHIVGVIDYGLNPAPYIVMEFFDGIELGDWIQKRGRLEFSSAMELFSQLCDGLKHAHSLGLIHRDLKPSNVLLKLDEGKLRSKILDFGIAKIVNEVSGQEKLTSTGDVVGSPPYMPPEQWTGRSDHRSDIYSLGCIMYEVLTGQKAFTAQNGIEYLVKHQSQYPKPMKEIAELSSLPDDMEKVVFKCLQKSPEKRYQSSAALQEDLEHIRQGRKLKIQSTKTFNPVLVALLGVALILGSLATVVLLQNKNNSTEISVANKNRNSNNPAINNSSSTNSSALNNGLSNNVAGGVSKLDVSGHPYNLAAIYDLGTAFNGGGFDNRGHAYEAGLMGRSVDFNGTTMYFGAANKMNAWTSTVIPLQGKGTELKILAAGTDGYQKNQTFIVNYSDGTSTKSSLNLSDTATPRNFDGEKIVLTLHYLVQSLGYEWRRQSSIYGYKIPLAPGKTPLSLSLPANRGVVVLSVALSNSDQRDYSKDPLGVRIVGLKFRDILANAFYTELKAKQRKPSQAFYQVCGFPVGWYGIQQTKKGRLLAFFQLQEPPRNVSGDRPHMLPEDFRVKVVYQDPAAKFVRMGFGGNLTALHCNYEFKGDFDKTYKFLVTACVANERTNYSFFVGKTSEKGFKRIATVSTAQNGQLIANPGISIYDPKWNSETGTESHIGEFGNTWVRDASSGHWVAWDKVKFFAVADDFRGTMKNIDAYSQKDKFFLCTGGDTANKHTALDESFQLGVVPKNAPANLPLVN